MTFSARTERRGQTINQLAAEKRLHKILDKPGQKPVGGLDVSHGSISGENTSGLYRQYAGGQELGSSGAVEPAYCRYRLLY